VERVKIELRALNPINQKRKWNEWGAPSKSVNQKKPTLAPRVLQAQQSHGRNVEEATTPLLNVEW